MAVPHGWMIGASEDGAPTFVPCPTASPELARFAQIALFTAWSVISVLTAIITGSFNVSQISGIISTVMAVAAIYMLFQPDAKAWFAEKRGD